jgi:glycosyltransferase involved in cell wall biosynthesis
VAIMNLTPAQLSELGRQVTPLLITFNEAPNLLRVLPKLAWAERIVIVDSGSTDATLDMLAQYPQAKVVFKTFTDFASQCNFGLSQVKTAWALSLDADYELTDDLVVSFWRAVQSQDIAGFKARFIYRICGRPLRGCLYPPRTVLYRTNLAKYRNEGHGHRVMIDGAVSQLDGVIYHDDRKPLSRWLSSQLRYAEKEASHLLSVAPTELSKTDRLRLKGWPAPVLIAFYTLFVRGCILDGWAGWFYVLQRLCAEVLLALEIVDRKLPADREFTRPVPEQETGSLAKPAAE